VLRNFLLFALSLSNVSLLRSPLLRSHLLGRSDNLSPFYFVFHLHFSIHHQLRIRTFFLICTQHFLLKFSNKMALSTLAGWTGSAIISNLVDVASSYLGEHLLPAGTKEELNRLKIALPKIKAVMSVAEALKLKHPNSGVHEWLDNFKLAFFAADDVLDELKYLELEDMVKNQNQVSESSSTMHGSLKRKFPGTKISKDTMARLREAVKMLDLAATDVGLFFQFATALHVHGPAAPFCEAAKISTRETTSFLTETKVFGRENERAKVIEWLKKPISHAHISALCIVGVGGLGKTTLAQLIFEDISKDDHFDDTIWICVSTSFIVEEITRKILQELRVKIDGTESLNDLQKKVKENIISKKVLFILDDVWNDDQMCDWDKLIAPLRSVQSGSKILLTTRMKSVAEMLARVLSVDQECLDLKGLEEQELLGLFNKYAFHGYNPNNHKDLQKMAKDIVKKLRGSPLAAKVIGSLLNSNVDFQYWKRIFTHDSLINLEQAKNVADVLKLSYYHLPVELQECFRFCSIFPQDHGFEKNELIIMWMASGFIRQQLRGEERPEDIGEDYFNHLLKKSFFEPRPWSKNYYIMHDLIHELAQNVSEGECCRVEPNQKVVNIPSSVQHVSVDECEIERVFHLRNLRTLIITMSENIMGQFVLPISSLKETLRVLVINVSCEVPEEIGNLKHLRYLTVSKYAKSVPHSIYKLHHLQLFEWYGENFETTGMTNLVNLRYMMLLDGMMQNIKGVHKLTSLQQLTFSVGHENGLRIDELKTLNNLRNLSIQQIENVRDLAEAKNAKLSEKKNLISLSLNWSEGSNSDNPEQFIDNLQPSPSLKELTIRYYKGNTSPIWMRKLPPLNLSSLTLANCPLWEDLPLLAQMPHLRKLSLLGMNEVKEVDYSFDSARNDYPFESLEQLCCVKMPNLRELIIKDCPNLTELPAIPHFLFKFEVCNVGLNSLPDLYLSSTITIPVKSSLRDVQIQNCPNLKSLNGFLQQENHDLQAVEDLRITNCENLVQLPVGAFEKFESLKHLSFNGNPKLLTVSNGRILLPVKLQTLDLGNCGEFDVQLLESASHLTTLHGLSIINSASITCIPFSENAFSSLRKLIIQECDKLIEYSSMKYAQGVSPGNNMASLNINELYIPHLSLLCIEPLRSLRFVRICLIADCSGFEALPEQWLLQNCNTLEQLTIYDASSLRSLPGTMVRLTSLKELRIHNATLLEEIPELPTTLIDKRIKGAGGRMLV
jgi:NB-ARC domain/Rx N-terminal domain